MKKLAALPKVPHTYDEVMKAMGVLHKLILKQSHAYGGKNSKYIPAQVVEGSLLKLVSASIEPISEGDKIHSLLDIAHNDAEALATLFKERDDDKGMTMLGQLLKTLSVAMSANDEGK